MCFVCLSLYMLQARGVQEGKIGTNMLGEGGGGTIGKK